jgi:hypothetical protein
MKMMTERYQGIQVRLVLPFRFLTKAKSSISLQPYLNPPIEWQKYDFQSNETRANDEHLIVY